MTLIIGTKNKAKIEQVRSVLEPLNFDVQGLPDQDFSEVREDGKTAIENAVNKAVFYSSVIGRPVLSMDNALYLDGLPSDEQPGLNVRRINDKISRPSDIEVLAYYSELIKRLGDRIDGYWEYGICLAHPDGRIEKICIKSPRIFVSRPSRKIVDGYPLESMQINPDTGQYISEMTKEQQSDFWRTTIGEGLGNFIKKSRLL